MLFWDVTLTGTAGQAVLNSSKCGLWADFSPYFPSYPCFFYFWKLTQDTVDYGFDAAMLMMVEQEAGLLYYVLVCLWQWLSAVVLTGMFVMALMTTVRRLTDMGFSPWWVILSSLPLINIVFLLMLFFWPGQRAAAQ